MITVVVGNEIEKIKGDYESYLNGLNMTGAISYSLYSQLYDEGTKQIQKAYELGKSKLETELAKRAEQIEALNKDKDYFSDALDKQIEATYKVVEENAELKEKNKMLEQGYVWHDYDAGEDCYEDSHEGKWIKRNEIYQLTKAKELLAKWVELFKPKGGNIPPTPIQVETEQFLSEVENEISLWKM